MQEIKQILSVVDPTTDSQPALEKAAWLAEKTGAKLELFVCYYNEYLSGDRLFDSPSLEKAREEILGGQEKLLEKLAAVIGHLGRTTATPALPLGGTRHCALGAG